jgi:hypothetical protein
VLVWVEALTGHCARRYPGERGGAEEGYERVARGRTKTRMRTLAADSAVCWMVVVKLACRCRPLNDVAFGNVESEAEKLGRDMSCSRVGGLVAIARGDGGGWVRWW